MSMPYFILAHLMFTDLLSIHPKLQCPGCLKSLLLMYSIIFLSEIGASFQKTAEKMVAVCTSMFRDYFLTWSMVNVTTRVNPLHMHSPLITNNQTQILY